MQLRQNVDYSHLQGTFPVTTKRFENLGALSLSPLYFWQKPLLSTFRGGFSCFWAPKKCTKIAPNVQSGPIWVGSVERLFVLFDVFLHPFFFSWKNG